MRHLLCVLILFTTLIAAHAKGGRTCRIIFINAPGNAPQRLHLFDGKTSQEVELPSINFSPVYQLPGSALTLRMLPSAETDPKQISPDAPSAAVAESVTDFYLLVSSDPANLVVPVRFEVIDATKFTKGQMLWRNLTPNTIDGQIGTEKLVLAGNSQAILNPPAAKSEDYKVTISYRRPGLERLEPLCETQWGHDAQGRSVYFVVSTEGERTPRVMGLRDQRETAKKSGKR